MMEIGYAKHDGLLKEIIHIEMPALKKISLSFDNIESLERITHLQAPALEHIDLCKEIDKIKNSIK